VLRTKKNIVADKYMPSPPAGFRGSACLSMRERNC
jgi:hypothetical protein